MQEKEPITLLFYSILNTNGDNSFYGTTEMLTLIWVDGTTIFFVGRDNQDVEEILTEKIGIFGFYKYFIIIHI